MAEFEWVNKQGVRSNQGFVVQRTGRYSMEYREGPHTLVFGVDLGVDPETRESLQLVKVYPFPTWAVRPLSTGDKKSSATCGARSSFRG